MHREDVCLEDAHNAEAEPASTQEFRTRFCCLCNTRAPKTGPMVELLPAATGPPGRPGASDRVASGPQRWTHDRLVAPGQLEDLVADAPVDPAAEDRDAGHHCGSRPASSGPTTLPRARPCATSGRLRRPPADARLGRDPAVWLTAAGLRIAMAKRVHEAPGGDAGALLSERAPSVVHLGGDPMTVSAVLDAAGRRRSPATMPGYLAGRPPRNEWRLYPADPPTVEDRRRDARGERRQSRL